MLNEINLSQHLSPIGVGNVTNKRTDRNLLYGISALHAFELDGLDDLLRSRNAKASVARYHGYLIIMDC